MIAWLEKACRTGSYSVSLVMAALAIYVTGFALVDEGMLRIGAVGLGGIVRDPEAHQRACNHIQSFIEAQPDLHWHGLIESSIQGTDGNREFLARFSKSAD